MTYTGELDPILVKATGDPGLFHCGIARGDGRFNAGASLSSASRYERRQWRLFSKAHSTGLRHDPKDPSKVHISLEATMRHRTFEHTTHLYNIQRLKRAQGLTAAMEVPEVGYWALPEWDRSEP